MATHRLRLLRIFCLLQYNFICEFSDSVLQHRHHFSVVKLFLPCVWEELCCFLKLFFSLQISNSIK
eukprot:12916326-Prorocentrum_lima.AAC.1